MEDEMAYELEVSDIEEIQEDVLQSSVYMSGGPNDCWVNLHLNKSLHAQENEPLQSHHPRAIPKLADTAMEVCKGYPAYSSSASNYFKLHHSSSGLTELSMDSPLQEGQNGEEIGELNTTDVNEFPGFVEIDGTFDTNSLDSDGSEEGSSQFYSGYQPLIYTQNFQALSNYFLDDASICTGPNEASIEQTSFIKEALGPGGDCGEDNYMVDDPKSCSSEELTISQAETNAIAGVQETKNQSSNLVNLHGDDFCRIKKISCWTSASEEEVVEAESVRELEAAGSSACLELLEDKLRKMTSTMDELSNAINLISAENINLRSKLSFVNRRARNGAMPPRRTPTLRHGLRVLPGHYIPSFPIPGLLLNMNFKNCYNGAEKLDSRRMMGTTVIGFCFIIMLLVPLSWKLGSQSTKDYNVPNSGRKLNLLIKELDQTNKNATAVNHCNMWSDPHDFRGITLEEPIVARAQRQTMLAKSAIGDIKIMKLASLIAESSNKIKGREVSALKGGIAVPLNGSERFSQTANIKCLKFPHSLTASEMTEQKGAKGHMPRGDQRKRVEDGRKGKHITLAAKPLFVPQDVQCFETNILKASKRYKRGIAERVKREVFRFLKALPNRRKVYSSIKSSSELESDGIMHRWLLQEFSGDIMTAATCTEYEASPKPGIHQANKTAFPTSSSSENRHYKAHQLSPIQDNALPSLPDALALVSIPPDSYKVDGIAGGHGKRFTNRLRPNQLRIRPFVVVWIVTYFDKSDRHTSCDGSSCSTALKIFIIIHIDGVKYVAYSCFFPFPGPESQVVTC